MLITDKGIIIRVNVNTVSQSGRATMGVKLMRLLDDSKIVTFALVDPEVEEIEQTEESQINE